MIVLTVVLAGAALAQSEQKIKAIKSANEAENRGPQHRAGNAQARGRATGFRRRGCGRQVRRQAQNAEVRIDARATGAAVRSTDARAADLSSSPASSSCGCSALVYAVAFLILVLQLLAADRRRRAAPGGALSRPGARSVGRDLGRRARAAHPLLARLLRRAPCSPPPGWASASRCWSLLGATNALLQFALWALYLSFVQIGQLFYGYGWETQLLRDRFPRHLPLPAAPRRARSHRRRRRSW